MLTLCANQHSTEITLIVQLLDLLQPLNTAL